MFFCFSSRKLKKYSELASPKTALRSEKKKGIESLIHPRISNRVLSKMFEYIKVDFQYLNHVAWHLLLSNIINHIAWFYNFFAKSRESIFLFLFFSAFNMKHWEISFMILLHDYGLTVQLINPVNEFLWLIILSSYYY